MSFLTLAEKVELKKILDEIEHEHDEAKKCAVAKAEKMFFEVQIPARRKAEQLAQRIEKFWQDNSTFIDKFQTERDKNFAKRILWEEYFKHYKLPSFTEIETWEIYSQPNKSGSEHWLGTVEGTFVDVCLHAVTLKYFFLETPWGSENPEAIGGRITKVIHTPVTKLNQQVK